tara:strand:+ start:472 stop:1080 length:609 start_codon:yes stop_codon:yes gene_type:complete
MAVLTQSLSGGDGPISGWDLQPAQAGNFMAVCLDVKDSFGIQRPKYEDPSIIETLDVTRFLFGLSDGSMVQTSEMKISAHEKSKLMGYLTSWLGITNGVGFDTESVKGKGAMINVVSKVSAKGRTYADITSISPVPQGMESQIPARVTFQIPGESAPAQPAPAQPVQAQPVQATTTVTVEQPQPVQQTMGQQFTAPAQKVPF